MLALPPEQCRFRLAKQSLGLQSNIKREPVKGWTFRLQTFMPYFTIWYLHTVWFVTWKWMDVHILPSSALCWHHSVLVTSFFSSPHRLKTWRKRVEGSDQVCQLTESTGLCGQTLAPIGLQSYFNTWKREQDWKQSAASVSATLSELLVCKRARSTITHL